MNNNILKNISVNIGDVFPFDVFNTTHNPIPQTMNINIIKFAKIKQKTKAEKLELDSKIEFCTTQIKNRKNAMLQIL